MILTAEEAAAELGTTEANVRKLVERGQLVPISPKARSLRFTLLEVARVQVARMSRAEHDALDRLAAVLDESR